MNRSSRHFRPVQQPRRPRRLIEVAIATLAVGATVGCSGSVSSTDASSDDASNVSQTTQTDQGAIDTTNETASTAETETNASQDLDTQDLETEDDSPGDSVAASDSTYPDVVDAEASQDDDGAWTFAVTISSPYDTPERYADAWRVEGPDGEVYGVRELAHDHANEQPFTRSQSGIMIPEDVTAVMVVGRDQLNGWGGQTLEVSLR